MSKKRFQSLLFYFEYSFDLSTRWNPFHRAVIEILKHKPRFGCSVLQLIDYRVEFSKWWVAEFKTIKYPSQGTVFDYFIHPETKQFTPWSEKIPKFELDPDIPLQVRVYHKQYDSMLACS